LLDLDSIDEPALIIASVRSVNSHSHWPRSYTQAKKSPAAEQWQAAIDKQMDALTSNETWELVDLRTLPVGAKILSGKWVYVKKEQENGQQIQKAR
jgi:hypothetical protein